MRVNSAGFFNPNFSGARISILAHSDTHGKIDNLPDIYNAAKINQGDIFKKSQEPSTLNLYVNAGDYFINPAKPGYVSKKTHPTNGDVQRDFFALTVKKIKKLANTNTFQHNEAVKKTGGKALPEANFDAIYTPGNHDFDGGDKMFYDQVTAIPGLSVVMSNINTLDSPLFTKELDKPGSNISSSKIYEIPDDKDASKKHHVLILGLTIPAMDFYNPGLLKGTNLLDKNDKKDSALGEKEIINTVNSVKNSVERFKKEHPKGIVLVNSHMGTRLSEILGDCVPDIDEIFDGHKHDIATIKKGKTHISSLGMDNNIIKAIALSLDDDGEIEKREERVYCSYEYQLSASERRENSLYRKLNTQYSADFNPLVRLNTADNPPNTLEYRKDIRFANSNLANYLTSTVKDALSEIAEYKDVDLVAIQSSIIRGGIEDGANNVSLLKVFDGVSEDLSKINVGTVSGSELIEMVLENIRANLKYPTRDTIIQWSDIKIDRDELKKMQLAGQDITPDTAAHCIRIRRSGNTLYSKINPDENYKIAVANKYLAKNDIKTPAKIRKRFVQTEHTYHSLWMNQLQKSHYNIEILPIHMETRIT